MRKVIRVLMMFIVALVLAVGVYFFILGQQSQEGQANGLVDNKLSPCPASPNCVNSEFSDDAEHFIAPYRLGGKVANWDQITEAIESIGGRVTGQEGDYLSATFTSSLFGFVDDVELRYIRSDRVLHFRSASRVGYSDLGANRKRINALKERLLSL